MVATASVSIPALPFGIRLLVESDLSVDDRSKLFLRPKVDLRAAKELIRPILGDVREHGDVALVRLTERFEGVQLTVDSFVEDVASLPWPKLQPDVEMALNAAYKNVAKFHRAQKPRRALCVQTSPGVECRQLAVPIEAVGLYVPGGSAILPSTAYMLATPAQIAGCRLVVLATPPRADGSVCPEVVYAAKLAGVTKLLKAGGAQAIAAMAYGTASCPKVQKIVGPGNQYVTAAKMELQSDVDAGIAIDMPAGPSEQLCIFDLESRPRFVVADLLSQAEHGADSQVVGVLVVDPPGANNEAQMTSFIDRLHTEFEEQVSALPRHDVVKQALGNSYVIVVDSIAAAVDFSNSYAPEHLVIQTLHPEAYLRCVRNAGSVFLGEFSPESCGDYASGTNHCLPTSGYARQYGGVSLNTFLKYITVQKLSAQGLRQIGPTVEALANLEGLQAHRRAVSLRLEELATRPRMAGQRPRAYAKAKASAKAKAKAKAKMRLGTTPKRATKRSAKTREGRKPKHNLQKSRPR
eukprot:gnl/TRDRNA2_/TRDRNA2_159358_c0_seq1.p1 gnl/TRDRNA2_/TRDRNA2_159358_c0~~gnl/TRDRNA2_/TRDRNA2_159358_c0_seq1.p1  ORF type:complete len:522 (+),score=90.49 gnl/TRDRNA2_/TRDRNA2_159358_c0_seq1:86-1651(+)